MPLEVRPSSRTTAAVGEVEQEGSLADVEAVALPKPIKARQSGGCE